MSVEYVIIQAGGKGTRMKQLTHNKPKALVPVQNLPMIFHCFKQFSGKRFIIIGDYKCDVLKKYLEVFCKEKYIVVDAEGAKGTCGGIKKALDIIPENISFLLMWSDLVLPKDIQLPTQAGNYIGISKDFECRWSYKENSFEEIASKDYGVAGFFVFQDKHELKNVPAEGEFVRWLQEEKKTFNEIGLYKTREYGLISEYQKLQTERCRPFNQLIIEDNKIIKQGIDEQGRSLAVREKAWYHHVESKGFKSIPQIYSYEPFTMEKVNGKNIFECNLDFQTKKQLLKKIVDMLQELHSLQEDSVDFYSIWNNYFTKTFERLNKIQNLVPFALDPAININGTRCRNVFFHKEILENFLSQYHIEKFALIHGDCTFSNMMLNGHNDPILIDPRGYFGYTQILGDTNYDWAKIYYSLKGNYDQFNLKRFRLSIDEKAKSVELEIESNHWEELEEYYFELLHDYVSPGVIKMLHAIIWLSLTTYAWEDYDSICGAFYNGLLYFEEAIHELS